MTQETARQLLQRSRNDRLASHWLRGLGMGIGVNGESPEDWRECFPRATHLRLWSGADGDAVWMPGVANETFDFVYVQCAWDQIADPRQALDSWIRIGKVGGYVVLTLQLPDGGEAGRRRVRQLLDACDDRVSLTKFEVFDTATHGIDIVLQKTAPTSADLSGTRDLFAKTAADFELRTQFGEAVKLHQEGQLQAAFAAYQQVLAAQPEHVDSLSNLSLLLVPDAALSCLRRALEINPDHVASLLNMGDRLLNASQAASALTYLERAHHLAPQDSRAILGLSRCHEALDDFGAALALADCHPECFQSVDDLRHLAELAESNNQPERGLDYALRALAVAPEDARAHIQAARHLLKLGNFKDGLPHLEWIWHGRLPTSQLGLLVDGYGQLRLLQGKTVVLSADSGLGDTLQFVRYGRLLHDAGARVIVECQAELCRLLRQQPWIDEVVEVGQLQTSFDWRLPLHNLMGAFRTDVSSIPAPVPYIACDPVLAATWAQRLQTCSRPLIGLCWAGNPNLPRDHLRSIPVGLLDAITQLPGATFLSLQKGVQQLPAGVADYSAEWQDMADTAAFISALDLVLAVDTSVAHLAAAMGKPVWLLNRFDGCWRWLTDRDDSPWYPQLRQFRQGESRDWAAVLARVRGALQEQNRTTEAVHD